MPRKKIARKLEAPVSAVQVKDDKNERDTIIMFVDIMGASEVSNNKSLKDYFVFVNKFQALFKSVCKKCTEQWYDDEDLVFISYPARGDEGLLMIYRPTDQVGIASDIDAAINIALQLKREWLCTEENRDRIINHGLLPINLAVGIHAGRTYLEKTDIGWLPEGYAINLAKRVESYSRQGRFTHIFLSEAAHGYLNLLPDERLYLFDSPQVFTPKGISRDISVYEVKHHYLPSDWNELVADTSRRSKSLLDSSCVNLDVLQNCIRINPTNLWLVEEFIRSTMLKERGDISDEQFNDKKFMKTAYQTALDEANRLSQSDQRDAGALYIQGLIEGERGDSENERDRYQDAIDYTDQLAEPYWYKALSYSYEVFESIDNDLDKGFDDLDDRQKQMVEDAKTCYKKAKIRRSNSAWIPFDYGCEIIRWAKTKEEIEQGIEQIELAVSRLDEVRNEIKDQDYLQKVLTNPRILNLLPK